MGTQTGIAPIGEVEWGCHFCHFYKTSEDLAETLAPFFKTGLERTEACIWVTAQPLPKDQAFSALNAIVDDLPGRIQRGQIALYGHDEWYELHRRKSKFETGKAWVEATRAALEAGYEGLRLTGNTAFVEAEGWSDFMDYEDMLRHDFLDQKLIALCSYEADRFPADAVLDVIQAHDFALARRRGAWEMVESASVKRTKAQLAALTANLEALVTERTAALTEALSLQQFLTAELSHRVKNTVASIQTIVEQTLRRASVETGVRATLRGRLNAMGHVHERLAAVEWTGVDLSDLLTAIFAPFPGRFTVELGSVALTPRATFCLGLMFHELATNASKYGALSSETGMVTVTCRREGDRVLLEWRESGGPTVSPPDSDGFGLTLVRQLVAHDLEGEVELRFEPQGLSCLISASAREAVQPKVQCSCHA